jgi:hypothetical protein
MEMYMVDRPTLSKFLDLVLGLEDSDALGLLKRYAEILQELFLIRAANELLKAQLSWIDFTSFCSRSDDHIEFYRVEHLRNLLQSSSATGKQDELLKTIEQLRPKLQSDFRHRAHGHDFLALLTFDKRSIANRRGLRNQEAVPASLRGCLSLELLKEESLFRQLDDRMK